MPKTTTEIIALFGKPAKEVVAYFDQKYPQASEGWETVDTKLHQSMFTVANTAGHDVIDDIKSALIEARDSGQTFKQFQQNLEPILRAKGWWGKAVDYATGEILKTYPGTDTSVKYGSPARLRLIYDANLAASYGAGRRERQLATKDLFPYWRYVAVMDRRTRPAHGALNGMIFRADSGAWSVIYPPNGFRCRCIAQALMQSDIDEHVLTVQTGGQSITKEVPVNKAGTLKTVKGWKTSKGLTIYPDPGWDSAPGLK